MEKTVIISGLSCFLGSVFWKKDLSEHFYIGSLCIAYYNLQEVHGIAKVDRLYPLKPKNPI